MYIIEKIIKFFIEKKKKKQKILTSEFNDNYELEDIVTCNHNFLPIDSTKEIFACSKCGYLINRKRLKNIEKKRLQNNPTKNNKSIDNK